VALQELVGLGGTGRVTPKGAFRSFAYDVPADVDPSVLATLQQFEQQLPALAVPLPDEPIGVGGRWRTTGRTTLAGVTLDQVTTYEVTKLTDTGVAYDVTTTQRAAEQALAGLPEGTTARLVSSDVAGTGSGSLELDALVASATSTLTGTQELELVRGTEPAAALTQQLDVAVTVAVGA
ncbi:MAG TPA: hypothetical protein VHK88_13925, partial [Aquihabitans sp.]|nr:hypothetical protein [Aquihabitans sp.]